MLSNTSLKQNYILAAKELYGAFANQISRFETSQVAQQSFGAAIKILVPDNITLTNFRNFISNTNNAAILFSDPSQFPQLSDFNSAIASIDSAAAAYDDIKAEKKAAKKGGRKYGSRAMSAQGTARNFSGDGEGQGYTPATRIPSKDYSQKSTTNSTDQYKAKKKSEDKAPRRSPAAGREDMMSRQRRQEIMDREERKRKNDKEKGGSNVVGS